jgi:hypothetical protein
LARTSGVDRRVPQHLDASGRNGADRGNPFRRGQNLRQFLRPFCRHCVHRNSEPVGGACAAPVDALDEVAGETSAMISASVGAVIDQSCPNCGDASRVAAIGSPPQQEEGRQDLVARSRKLRSHISSRRRGGVVQESLDHTTPSAPSKDASLLLLDVAATPPPAEEGSSLRQTSTDINRLEPLPRLGFRSNLICNLDPCGHRPRLQKSPSYTFLGSRASRRPSPMKLIESTVRKIIAPGISTTCGAIANKSLASNNSRPQVG